MTLYTAEWKERKKNKRQILELFNLLKEKFGFG